MICFRINHATLSDIGQSWFPYVLAILCFKYFLESLYDCLWSLLVLTFYFSHYLLSRLVFVFLILFSNHQLIFQGSHFLYQKFFQLVWIFLYFLLQDSHLGNQVGQIFTKNFVKFVSLGIDLLNINVLTETASRCVFALPDCSPIVLLISLIPVKPTCSFDIYIT